MGKGSSINRSPS